MGNSLRCCLACVLPCGALDLIRIVHLNGYVEEITRAVTAGEILKEYPNHVLSRPTASQGMVRKILILSSDTELKRGTIYFLIPNSSLPSNSKTNPLSSSRKINTHKLDHHHHHLPNPADDDQKTISLDLSALDHNQNHVEPTSKSKSARHQRKRSSRGKSGVWHPHLDSITED